jgi:DNA-binding transcriptional LysR family regulator
MSDQNRTMLDWEDVRFFIALTRHGSLSAAARALSVNHATVSRRIVSLETTLGERLVERRPDGYILTTAGTRVLGSANDMENAASVLRRGSLEDGPKGLVRINAPPSLAHGFLVSRIASLTALHPGLDLDLASELRSVSLERREADVAIRLGRPHDGDIVAKRLVEVGFGFYASAKWRSRLKDGISPVFVGFDELNATVAESVWISNQFPRARISFRTNSQLGQAEAARADAGIALLPHFIGRSDDRLGLCSLDVAPPARELWLLVRRTDLKTPSIRILVDHLVGLFRDERKRFE